MKYGLLIISVVFGYHSVFVQITKGQIPKLQKSVVLNVGDEMPDIPLGKVMNNHTGKTRFSQFKGKLVILDFWSTYCSTCLALFPHMEQLQKQFGDSIQIILVNPKETQEQIDQRLKLLLYSKKFRLPDLPSIIDAKQLDALFPTSRGQPHHVWIDANGIIRVRGASLNTYEEKIRDLLHGREIFSMKDDNSAPVFDKDKPYYEILAEKSTPMLQYISFFTAYNGEYAAIAGGNVEDKVDSTNHTIRTTFINRDVLRLYGSVFRESIQKNIDKMLYNNGIPRTNNFYLLFVNDTLKYTFDFLDRPENEGYADKNFVKSKFCYEQVLPLNLPETERRKYMLENLNRYFGGLYGMQGSLEKIKTACYVIQRISNEDKLSTKSGIYKWGEQFIKNGVKMNLYNDVFLKQAITHALLYGLFDRNQQGKPKIFLLDETNISGRVDIILPDASEMGSIEDLRKALKPYDLDIIKTERELEMIVIKEKDYHN